MPASESKTRTELLWAGVAIVAAAAALRFAASFGDLWLDEIWSWSLTLNLSSAWSILTEIEHDNNHFLNTFVIYLLGPNASPWLYRFPAVLAGVGSVIVAGRIARRQGAFESVAAMLLVGGSYLCIHYSSEARGYAYVALFAPLSFLLLERALEKPRWTRCLAFAAVAVLGFLSHLVYVFCFAALVLWSLVHVWRTRRGRLCLVACHLPPAVFAFWLYLETVRGVVVGGSDARPLSEILAGTLSLALGGPESAGPWRLVAAAITLLVLVAALVQACRTAGDRWIFYVAVLLGPLLLLLHPERQFLHARHFLIPTLFLLILAAGLLGRLWASGSRGKWACGIALLLFLAANSYQTERLIRLGRGNYKEALDRMVAETRGPVTRLAGDHDFRNGLLFFYYKRTMPDPEALYYYTAQRVPDSGTEWYLRHSTALQYEAEPILSDTRGNRYLLVEVYPFAGLSGWHWAVYRHERALRAEATE